MTVYMIEEVWKSHEFKDNIGNDIQVRTFRLQDYSNKRHKNKVGAKNKANLWRIKQTILISSQHTVPSQSGNYNLLVRNVTSSSSAALKQCTGIYILYT